MIILANFIKLIFPVPPFPVVSGHAAHWCCSGPSSQGALAVHGSSHMKLWWLMRDLGGGSKSLCVRTAAVERSVELWACCLCFFSRKPLVQSKMSALPVWAGSEAVGYCWVICDVFVFRKQDFFFNTILKQSPFSFFLSFFSFFFNCVMLKVSRRKQ